MSKKQFKFQASSSRLAPGVFGAPLPSRTVGHGSSAATTSFGAVSSSALSYVFEPPDLNRMTEPHVVVCLKNLQKKDSITKGKALEELRAYFSSRSGETAGLQDSILEAWVRDSEALRYSLCSMYNSSVF